MNIHRGLIITVDIRIQFKNDYYGKTICKSTNNGINGINNVYNKLTESLLREREGAQNI